MITHEPVDCSICNGKGMKQDATLLNYLLLVLGLSVVWFSTHNWVAVIGAFVASIHVTIRARSTSV